MTRRILIVEDGREYWDAFTRLAPPYACDFVRATNLEEARALLLGNAIDAVFLDVIFDRVPEEVLTGDSTNLIERFGGDRARAVRHLAEHQGFYILGALAELLYGMSAVVLAHDFAEEPQRLEALRQRVPSLAGLPDGAPATVALKLLGLFG